MKGDIVKLKGEDAKVIGEVSIPRPGRPDRPIVVQMFILIASQIFIVSRNGFAQGTFVDKALAEQMFVSIIMDEATL